MRMLLLLLLLLICCLQTALAKPQDIYPFADPTQQQRFLHLLDEYRCLVCQNENLAASDAPLANDLKQQIYQRIQAKQSDADINHYLVSRYGDFILYRPPLQANTLILWLLPFLLLVGSLGGLILYFKSKSQGQDGI